MSENEGQSHECAFLLEPEVLLVSYHLVGRHITSAVLITGTGMSKKSRLFGSVLRIACWVPYSKPEWHTLQSQSYNICKPEHVLQVLGIMLQACSKTQLLTFRKQDSHQSWTCRCF